MIVRVVSSRNSTRHCVTPPREPVRPSTCNQLCVREIKQDQWRRQKRTLITRASFTGAFDESCNTVSRTLTFLEDGKNHCFVSEMIASKQVTVLVVVDTSDQSSYCNSKVQTSKSEPVITDSTSSSIIGIIACGEQTSASLSIYSKMCGEMGSKSMLKLFCVKANGGPIGDQTKLLSLPCPYVTGRTGSYMSPLVACRAPVDSVYGRLDRTV